MEDGGEKKFGNLTPMVLYGAQPPHIMFVSQICKSQWIDGGANYCNILQKTAKLVTSTSS